MNHNITHTIGQVIDDFSLLEEWEDRYRYIVELGSTLIPLSDSDRIDRNRVRGCASQVWLVSSVTSDESGCKIYFIGDSDAHIVKGLIAIVILISSGKLPEEILQIDYEALFSRLGLREHLTVQRSNGINSLIARIRADASNVLRDFDHVKCSIK